ncbi:MAG: TetR/AcrR family transcriptional regulator [Cyanobacteria bacterium J06559_3]
MSTAASIDTKEQILNVAECMIAERGFTGTTLRSIVSQAGVNLAAVHYHFGSKEELFRATVERLARPVTQYAVTHLKQLQDQDAQPAVEDVLKVFLMSSLTLIMGDENSRMVRAQFLGRCRTEPGHIQDIGAEEFHACSQAMLDALQRALPEQSRSQLHWKLDLAIAVLIRVQMEAGKPGALIQSNQPEDIEKAVSHLVTFLAAGMRS